MVSLNLLVVVCLLYAALLFAVAFAADRLAERRGYARWVRSPLVYTLSLSIYCTAWTFYGAVGSAARSGLEFATIYLGPTLVMIGWWFGLRRLVRVGRARRVTSIADLLSARYGKSNLLAAGVTILAVIAITPYIALQLQSITLSIGAFARADPGADFNTSTTGLWIVTGLIMFAILFGTRNLDANERHHGVVMAIALEAVVKLCALVAVGVFVVWSLSGGIGPTLESIDQSRIGTWNVSGSRWAGLTFLSAAAFVCLPRMFQVMVVENEDERHLRTAGWAFPLYLFLMSLCVVPIAVVGLEVMPAGSNPDLFVLTLPLSQNQEALALLAFLGGFSAATSMVIVSAIALSIMVSNHIVMPLWLSSREGTASVSGDVRQVVLLTRRISIAAIMVLGYLYFRATGGGALAAIGLTAFTGIAQILPALIGGLFWRGGTRIGALAGLSVGFALWLYTLLLPSLGAGVLPDTILQNGPFGLSWLRPQSLFGIGGLDPLIHAMFWSLSLNTLAFTCVSLLTDPSPMERLEGGLFVGDSDTLPARRGWGSSGAHAEDLMIMTQRILGASEAQAFFQREAQRQGGKGHLPATTPDFLDRLERQLGGSVGTATAHAMVAQITGGSSVSVEDLMAVADESAQILEYSNRLETQSEELGRTAEQLRKANRQLTEMSAQKDAFLSQVSHELRTPMTSIRAFSQFLRDEPGLSPADKMKFSTIIHDESLRLTRLLDDLLDLSVLESGQVSLNTGEGFLSEVIDHAVSAALAGADRTLAVKRSRGSERVLLKTDLDRLAQVFINLIANAQKYCDADQPELTISVTEEAGEVTVDFLDNGSGIPPEARDRIFEKFSRVAPDRAGGAGLGLAICLEIMQRLGGRVEYLAGHQGGAFRVHLPAETALAAQ